MLEKDWRNPTDLENESWCLRALEYLDTLDVFIKGSLPESMSSAGFTMSTYVGQNPKKSFRVLYLVQNPYSLDSTTDYAILEFGKILSKIMDEYPNLSDKPFSLSYNKLKMENLCRVRMYRLIDFHHAKIESCFNRLKLNYKNAISKIDMAAAKDEAKKIYLKNCQNRVKRGKERFVSREPEVIDFVKRFILTFNLQDHPELVLILMKLPLESMVNYLSKGKITICPYVNTERVQEAVKLAQIEKIIKS